MMNTYCIPEENVPALRIALDKLVRRATKLGIEPISYEVGAFEDRSITVDAQSGYVEGQDGVYVRKTKTIIRRYFQVTVTGAQAKMNGWELQATLDHGEEVGVVLRCVPGVRLPESFRTAVAKNCDHCRQFRRRAETFVVRHEDGTYKQVGRQCLSDFLGGKDAQELARVAELLFSVNEICEGAESDGFFGGGRIVPRVETRLFLAQAAAVIRVDGFMSRRRAMDGEPVTADGVWSILNPSKKDLDDSDWRKYAFERKITEIDEKVAEEVLVWGESLSNKEDYNDFLYNCNVVLRSSSVAGKNAGLATAAVASYLREKARLVEAETKRQKTANSTHFGAEGERVFFVATIMDVISTETMWGSMKIVKLVTDEGNAVTWFGSGSYDLTIGSTYNCKATVKKHDTYKGVKQTIVNRLVTLDTDLWNKEKTRAERKAAKQLKQI